jgi:hypothetical protein
VNALQSKDSRYFPREYGRIDLRYTVARGEGANGAGREWVEGRAPVEGGARWYQPDPFMDFSASGLCFQDDAPLAEQDLLLLEMKLPMRSEPYRATGRVVRAMDLESIDLESDGPQLRSVAVNFEELPRETVEALVDFTDHVQSRALGVDPD